MFKLSNTISGELVIEKIDVLSSELSESGGNNIKFFDIGGAFTKLDFKTVKLYNTVTLS